MYNFIEAETVNIRSAESARLAANARPVATTDAVYKNVQTLVETNRQASETQQNTPAENAEVKFS